MRVYGFQPCPYSNGVATGLIMFKAVYSRKLTCHFLFILAHLLSVSISFYDFTILFAISCEQLLLSRWFKKLFLNIDIFYFVTLVYCSFKTIDLSENREHQYLNALKLQKNTVIRSIASPLLGKWLRCFINHSP